MDALEISWCAD